MGRSTLPSSRLSHADVGVTHSAALIVVEGEALGRRFVLTEDAEIGRDSWCSLHVPDLCASRHHATLRNRDGIWFIEDNKSRNGTYVNGKRVERTRLWYGDRIGLGAQLTLLFARVDSVELHEARMQRLGAMSGLASDVAREFGVLFRKMEDGNSADALAAAHDLVQDLMAFASEHNEDFALESVSKAVDYAVEALRTELVEGVDLLVDCDERQLEVDGPGNSVERILLEIGRAALGTMSDGGSLRMAVGVAEPNAVPSSLRAVTDVGPHLLIEILSSGVELTTAELWQLFEPFRTGHGVGAAVAFGNIRLLNGDIDIARERGVGTRFTVVLPLALDPDSDRLEPEDTDAGIFEEPTRIEGLE